ncbi:Uncharacterised protein [Burkholderia pseudomallei]|nr:Uncharacterised protein [Burkholderia pseudomallei]
MRGAQSSLLPAIGAPAAPVWWHMKHTLLNTFSPPGFGVSAAAAVVAAGAASLDAAGADAADGLAFADASSVTEAAGAIDADAAAAGGAPASRWPQADRPNASAKAAAVIDRFRSFMVFSS